MTTFLTIGYGDQAGYDATPSALRDAAHASDAKLVAAERAFTAVLGRPTQVRNHQDEKTELAAGPFMRSDLPVAGFSLLEADSLEEAIEIASRTPCAIANGVVEVWPLELVLGGG